MIDRRELANAIRVLSMDAVQKANSGHPGMPMGMADIAEVLWNEFLNHNPQNPHWLNRDRFILSNGHGSMLQYALLHLSGYSLTLDDLRQFRSLHSKTPGHPELFITPGVETTTGPLGQGLANAVGMAIAEKHLAAEFNREGFPIIDHYTYVFMGDGCLMEGISHEVCSLAGTLQLGKLIAFYDDNGISIDGQVQGWFTDDTKARFSAYGWHVLEVDGHDAESVAAAIVTAKKHLQQPTIICCKTMIGWGAPNLGGSADTHGAPLGDVEIEAARVELGWSHDPFVIPDEIYAAWDAKEKGHRLESEWQTLFSQYQHVHPTLAIELQRRLEKRLPEKWADNCQQFISELNDKAVSQATRKSSQLCINYFAHYLPELVGGSADLTASNLTDWKTCTTFTAATPQGNYINYGVREFGMSAIMNGIALYGAHIPFGGTFLCFSDYARNAVRLAAIMQQQVIFIYTHDSIGLGEDGPTHQPIEHAASLRLIPNLSVWRPCDAVETAVAWQSSLEYRGPSCLLLTRQNVPAQQREATTLPEIARGGYVLVDCAASTPDLILFATGSEVSLAVEAAVQLTEKNQQVRVVSMPSVDKFLEQDQAYQESVLPTTVSKRIAIEAGSPASWYQFVGLSGRVIGLQHFGFSAPAKDVFAECGFTVEHILQAANELLAR